AGRRDMPGRAATPGRKKSASRATLASNSEIFFTRSQDSQRLSISDRSEIASMQVMTRTPPGRTKRATCRRNAAGFFCVGITASQTTISNFSSDLKVIMEDYHKSNFILEQYCFKSQVGTVI